MMPRIKMRRLKLAFCKRQNNPNLTNININVTMETKKTHPEGHAD